MVCIRFSKKGIVQLLDHIFQLWFLLIYILIMVDTWIFRSANIGVFICLNCCGVHRSLGTHISKVIQFLYCCFFIKLIELRYIPSICRSDLFVIIAKTISSKILFVGLIYVVHKPSQYMGVGEKTEFEPFRVFLPLFTVGG